MGVLRELYISRFAYYSYSAYSYTQYIHQQMHLMNIDTLHNKH
jgi:hypothetical protein